jgi:hypothetical protein
VSKSMFEKKACDAERDSELRRLNEAIRENRLVWQARVQQEFGQDNLPEIRAKQRAE